MNNPLKNKTPMYMKNIRTIILSAGLLSLSFTAALAQNSDVLGVVTYSLPRTVIRLEVEAEISQFHAGPYAKFAQKYLGSAAPSVDGASANIVSVRMTPLSEADQSKRFVLPAGVSASSFLALTAQGLVSVGAGEADQSSWAFASAKDADFAGKGVSSNLTSESTVLYRNVKGQSQPLAVQQSMVVEKPLEARAQEAAEMIFSLRKKKVQIVTGDTDATFSGEALPAAIAEIDKLEKEYLSLFMGYSDTSTQKMNFDVIPTPENKKQMYVAFRLSESEGLVSAENVSGKPYIIELQPQSMDIPTGDQAKAKGTTAMYRVPNICALRLTDGVRTIFQSRIPVYQLGLDSSFPIAVK